MRRMECLIKKQELTIQESKTLLEFLEELNRLTEYNILFLKNKKSFIPRLNEKYLKEFQGIQDLINTFDFVKEK
jgi:hypothetical protein